MSTAQVLEIAEEALTLVPELPDSCRMRDGVGTMLQGIADGIRDTGRVSPKQEAAVASMSRAVHAWFPA